jgi:hypothetical protein
MLKKTLIATAVAGALAATTGAAFADGYGSGKYAQDQFHKPPVSKGYAFGGWVGGPGWQLRLGDFKPAPRKAFPPAVQKVCGPTYQKVQVWKPGRGWVWDSVYSGQSCRLEKIYPTNSPVQHTPYPYKIR